MSPGDLQGLIERGGISTLLIFLLITAVIMLWRDGSAKQKHWTETQSEDTRAMIESNERNTSAIIQLTELLKANAVAANNYQTEMRTRVYGELEQLQKFRGEMGARLDEIANYFKMIDRGDRHDRENRRPQR